ncbi:hypothetical protein BJ742DRAFT_875106 [Cladochytrium replicatum]|nr:hypothetical protein BJ742DRAFT_875106 [Cladochytrium replicatum]
MTVEEQEKTAIGRDRGNSRIRREMRMQGGIPAVVVGRGIGYVQTTATSGRKPSTCKMIPHAHREKGLSSGIECQGRCCWVDGGMAQGNMQMIKSCMEVHGKLRKPSGKQYDLVRFWKAARADPTDVTFHDGAVASEHIRAVCNQTLSGGTTLGLPLRSECNRKDIIDFLMAPIQRIGHHNFLLNRQEQEQAAFGGVPCAAAHA